LPEEPLLALKKIVLVREWGFFPDGVLIRIHLSIGNATTWLSIVSIALPRGYGYLEPV
jgi:hypothetical protein